MKCKNLLGAINDLIFSTGWTMLCNIVGKAKSPNDFHWGLILRTRFSPGNSPGWIQPEYRDRAYDDDENETPIWSKTLLKKVKSYIHNNLGLAKVNIIDPRKGDFVQPLKVTELLTELQIADDDFYSGLSISKDDDFELHI